MSKIFYDHLIILTEVEAEIKNIAQLPEEREELWQIVDEIIHNKILNSILDTLPAKHHEEFLVRFHKAPHDDELIIFLNEKAGTDIEELIRKEMKTLSSEILQNIR